MMRLLVGGLIVVNVLVFLYGYLGLNRQGDTQPVAPQHRPDVGSIRLISAKVGSPPATAPEEPQEAAGGAEAAGAEEPSEPPEPPAIAQAQEPSQAPDKPAQEQIVPPSPAEASDSQAMPAIEPAPAEAGAEPQPGNRSEPAQPEAGPSPVEHAEAMPEAEEQAQPVEEQPVRYCGEAGPFLSRSQARRLVRKLKLEDEQYRIQRKPTPVNVSFWVFRPPLPDRASARQEVARLKEAGIKDLWLMPEGEFRNGISLGLYSKEEAARSHAEKLRAKGFEVEVRPRQKMKERYWLAFSRLPTELVEKLQAALPAGGNMEKKVCDLSSDTP